MKRTRLIVFVIPLLILLLAACGAPAQNAAPTQAPAPEAAATSAPAAQGQIIFVIDPEQSQASYTVNEQFLEKALPKLGINPGKKVVTGVTKQVEGELHVNPADLSQPPTGSTITVKLTDLKTDQSRRDKWIQENGPSFLSHPLATFQAKEIQDAPAAYQEGEEIQFKLAGDLTIRNITQPVVFNATAKVENGVLTGSATTQIKMSDFGIEPPSFANTLTVGDDVIITVNLVAKQQ